MALRMMYGMPNVDRGGQLPSDARLLAVARQRAVIDAAVALEVARVNLDNATDETRADLANALSTTQSELRRATHLYMEALK